MTAHGLPPILREAIARMVRDIQPAELAARAAKLSDNYRARGGSETIKSFEDVAAYLATRMPATFAGIVIAGLSLIGVPGTVGFVGKWLLVTAALEQGLVWLAIVIVGSSALAVVYVWRIVEAACFKPAPAGAEFGEMPPSMLIPAWVLVGFCLYFGLDTSLTTEVAERAARLLITGVPG